MHVAFAVGDLELEGDLRVPAGAGRGAVVCHPHPQYGGNMFNPVVRAIADTLEARGCATLRFNFRGVGESQGAYGGGVAELEDVRAAVQFVRERAGVSRLVLAGYSFGAMVALRSALELPGVERLIAVAPPIAFAPLDPLAMPTQPTLYLAGAVDPYCPADALMAQVAAGPASGVCHILPGADHFLYGNEPEVAAAVREFVGA